MNGQPLVWYRVASVAIPSITAPRSSPGDPPAVVAASK
ncbi:Uncharacterised protein [Mycobacteroides abscessus subsp. abscessus]|nr:Uncharacterised protein [Mycobacteroides abscessus subsp. abscessus]